MFLFQIAIAAILSLCLGSFARADAPPFNAGSIATLGGNCSVSGFVLQNGAVTFCSPTLSNLGITTVAGGPNAIIPNSTQSLATMGLYELLTVSGSGHCATGCQANFSSINADTVSALNGATLKNFVGWEWNMNAGGPGLHGFHGVGAFNLLFNTTSGQTDVGASYGALGVFANASVNDNGTGLVPSGQLAALTVIGRLTGTATNWLNVAPFEVDTSLTTGTSTAHKQAVKIVQLTTDVVAGSIDDQAIAINNQADGLAGWQCVFCIGSVQGFWPGTPTSTLISAIPGQSASGSAAKGIDFSAITLSDSFLKGPAGNFIVNGAGDVTAHSLTTVTGGNLPIIVGNSALPFLDLPASNIGSNGAITVSAALDNTYTSAYAYAPANSIDGSNTAGWYYTVCTTPTACTFKNNTYTSGTATIPGSPTAFSSTAPTKTASSAIVSGVTTTITLVGLCPTGAISGEGIYDVTAGKVIQTYASCAGSPNGTITLTAAALNAGSGSSDVLQFNGVIGPIGSGPTFSIPGNSMGLSGELRAEIFFSCPANSNSKTVAPFFGGVGGLAMTGATTNVSTVKSVRAEQIAQNLGATNVQITGASAYGTSTSSPALGAIDTTANQNLVFRPNMSVISDFIVLQVARATVMPGI